MKRNKEKPAKIKRNLEYSFFLFTFYRNFVFRLLLLHSIFLVNCSLTFYFYFPHTEENNANNRKIVLLIKNLINENQQQKIDI